MEAIVSGPVYVDLFTEATFGPAEDFHTQLLPAEGNWGRERTIGGSAWKFAVYWAAVKGKAYFVSRLPRPVTPDDCTVWQQRAFVDDARWLAATINAVTLPRLHLTVPPSAAQDGGVDYTFHLPHPHQHLWPVFSVCGGTSANLIWDDVLAVLQARIAAAPNIQRFVFLGGVSRTQILKTLAEAANQAESETSRLLTSVPLFVDFGRTDFRRRSDAAQQELNEIRQALRTVNFQLVLLDRTTATTLDILRPDYLQTDRERPKYFVVRPHGILPGTWWIYRCTKHGRTVAHIERQSVEAPSPAVPDQVPTTGGRRPFRVAELVSQFVSGGQPQATWQRYSALEEPKRIEDITTDPRLAESLRRLKRRLTRDKSLRHLIIYGETGTGKEVIAEWLHRINTRRHGAFVPVVCGQLEGDLIDSKLFGHKKGAFTGADSDRDGAFVLANGGTVLLDDLDALPLSTQSRLLRVIETGELQPLGSDTLIRVDAFTITTTNVDPARLVAERRLRRDLYHRLRAGAYLHIPPLRERPNDVERVANAYWEEYSQVWGTNRAMPDGLLAGLVASTLGGNFRELKSRVAHEHQNIRDDTADVLFDTLPELSDETAAPTAYGQPDTSQVAAGSQFDTITRVLERICSAIEAKGGGRPSAESPIIASLRDLAAPTIGPGTLEQRLRLLVERWSTACRQSPTTDASLRRTEIAAMLGLSEGQSRVLQDLLRKLKSEGILTLDGHRWRPGCETAR